MSQGSLLQDVQRIAIFRGLYLGDFLVAVPALRAIRKRFPDAEITFIGLPWAKELVRRYDRYLDRFVEFVGYPGIREVATNEERIRAFIAEQQLYGYDLAIQMHGSGGSSNPFVHTLGARMTAGSYEGEQPAFLDFGAIYPQDEHEVWRNLRLAEMLGCTELQTELEFPLFEEDHVEATTLLRDLPHADRPWIGLHPGARPPARRWPAEYFALVADELARRFNAQIVITGGPGEEAIVQNVIERVHVPVLNLTGKTSLGGLAGVISMLDLFISNDTGPAHLSHAVERPSITLFGPADYARWAPLDTVLHPTLRRIVECSPCGYWECPIDHRCLRWLTPSMVIGQAERFLNSNSKHISRFSSLAWTDATLRRSQTEISGLTVAPEEREQERPCND